MLQRLRKQNSSFDERIWNGRYLAPVFYDALDESKNSPCINPDVGICCKRGNKRAERFDLHYSSWEISEDNKHLYIKAGEGLGKITDCGYDQMVCVYTRLPAGEDILLSAEIEVCAYLRAGTANGQEGFGIFIRDTMEPDRMTGYPYSNMVLAGACGKRTGLFYRSGITAAGIEGAQDINRNSSQTDIGTVPIVCPGDSSSEKKELRTYDIAIGIRRGRVAASLKETIGNGEDHVSPMVHDLCSADLLFEREPAACYIGFMAARGADIRIRKDRFRMTRGEKMG